MVSGRKPKPVRRHSVTPVHDWAEVPDVAFEGAPGLEGEWSESVRDWWADVSSMPHCALWKRADWRFALDTALLASAFYGGDLRVGAELRRRETVMGMTADSRRDLRIRYAPPVVEEEPRSVTAIADYKKRLRR